MSIEQKLSTIEENQQKVFNAAVMKYAVKNTTEKSDFITATNSAEYDILEFGMEGKTEQKQYSGAQLFDLPGREPVDNPTYSTQATPRNFTGNKIFTHISPTNYVQPNHTVIYSIDGNVVTVNGSDLSYGVGFDIKTTGGQTYTISRKSGKRIAVGFFDVDGRWVSRLDASGNLIETFTVPDGVSWMLIILLPSSVNTDEAFVDIQLELGSTATSYEPYVGGQPSPSPDYPQEIVNGGAYDEESETYKVDCTVTGKNLLNSETVELVTNNAYWHRNDPLLLRANTPYTLTINNVPSNVTISLIHFNTTDDVTLKGAYQTNKLSFILTEDTYGYFRMTFGGVGSDLSFLNECTVQLEIGSTATDHLPFQKSKITLTSTQPISKWDKLVKRDGVWGWSVFTRNWTVGGGNYWTVYENSADYGGFYKSNGKNDNRITIEGYCNQGRVVTSIELGENTIFCGNDTFYFFGSPFYDVTLSDKGLANWSAHLNENPLEIWDCATEEQSFIPLPDEEQVLLNNLETYYGGTNMYNDQGCPMWIKYIVDPATLK